MKKHLVILAFCLWVFTNTTAQSQNIRIEGCVIENREEKQVPLASANITLFREDSTFIDGTSSDAKGIFKLTGIAPDNYFLRVSFLGYETVEIILKDLVKDIRLGNVELSESSVELAEVAVTANNVVQKVDRMIVYPTPASLKNAYDIYQLMNNLTIPRLRVNPITKSIETYGTGGVQTRINGIVASDTEMKALLAKDILRIEVIENPGERYGDNSLGAVINIIVRKREDGGQVNLQTMNSPHVLWGENAASVKYNHDKSQWGLNYDNRMEAVNTRKDASEMYYLGDDKTIERIQEGINDKAKQIRQGIHLSYNLSDLDKYTFNVVFRNVIEDKPYFNQSNKLYGNTGTDYIFAKTLNSSFYYSPALDVYFQKTLPKGQSIQFNVVGTLINTKTDRDYREYTPTGSDLAQVMMDVNGKKNSLIGEAIYDKTMEKIKLSAGMRHTQMHAENKYSGTNPVTSDMDQMQTSAFAELQGRFKSFSYIGSVGMTRSYFEEGNLSHTYYTFTPTVRISFAPHKNGFINYRFNTTPSIPSLGSLTDVEQALDTIQIVRGNPELMPYRIYNNTLNYSYNYKKMIVLFNVDYAYQNRPIMESVFVENGRLIIMDENQKSYQSMQAGGTLMFRNLDLWSLKNFLTLSLEGGVNNYRSTGNNYAHNYRSFYYNAMFMMNYKQLGLIGQYRKFKNTLVGETINKGENMTLFMGTYTRKNLQVGAGILFPFTNNYRNGSERISSVAPVTTWNYVKEAGRMVLIQLSYNFEFGKRYQSAEKKLNNSDSDAGVINTKR